jgi:SAM-dependent methyltransferase
VILRWAIPLHTGAEHWSDREFFRSGEINVANEIMSDMLRISGGRRSPLDLDALEIGCGVGRMTRMMARIFRSVTAVDVSTEMVERAKTHLKGLDNVTVVWGMALPFQRWRKHPFDFAFSFIVFQHIPASRWWRRTVGKYAGFFGLAGCLSSSSRAHIGPVMNPQIPGADYRSLKRSRACYCTQAFWLWFRESSEAAGASFSGPLASDQRALE